MLAEVLANMRIETAKPEKSLEYMVNPFCQANA